LDKLKKERVERTEKILKKLEKYKCYISMEDLQKEVKGDLISRAHIANAMMAKGFVYSKAEAFKIYLRTGGLASEPKKELNALEAVSFIKSNWWNSFSCSSKTYRIKWRNFRKISYFTKRTRARRFGSLLS